jgi:acyl carrier protein
MYELAIQNRTVRRQVLEEKVVRAVANALDLEPAEVTLASSLQHDLGAESLDYLDIAFSLEREFKVHFPREDLLQRAADHFGEDHLVRDGVVTELGLRMLLHAMPEVDAGLLRPGLRAAEVPGLFTVQTLVRVLDRLLAAKQQMSRQCPQCGAELAESSALPEYVCVGCQTVMPFPSGDDVMFEELVRMSEPEEQPR